MEKSELIRGLGRRDMTFIVINTIIGAGIFGLPAKVHGLIGVWSLLAFVICAVIIGFIVLCYAEVSSRFTASGGPYLYARETFGSFVGFEVGWLYWIVRLTTFSANCNLFVTYLGFFDERLATGTARALIITLVVVTLGTVNLAGIKQTALATNIFTAGKLIPLILFVAIGVFFISPANFTFDTIPETSQLSAAVLLLIYAFVGFEVSVVLGGEARDPQRTLPFALLVAVAVVAVLYILIQIVSIGTLPGLAASERPIADAAMSFIGPFGATLITVGALISILGNLNVGLLGGTRLLFAMGENRDLPSSFAAVHSRFKTPYLSIILTTAIILVLTIWSSFFASLAIAVITRLLVYATTCLALPVLRRRENAPEARFRAPAGIAASILSLLLIAWLMTNIDVNKEGLPILIAALIGVVIFFAIRLFGNRPTSNASDVSEDLK